MTKMLTLLVTSSQESSAEPNHPHRREKLSAPSPVPMRSWQGSLPPPRHSFSTSATQKSHFLSQNTMSLTQSHGPPARRDEPFLHSTTKRARLRAHKHKRAILAGNQVLPSAFCCHRVGTGARYPVPGCSAKHSVWITTWVTVALPPKNRHGHAAGQGLKLLQGLPLDKIVKNQNSPSGFGIKNQSCLAEGTPECFYGSGQMCQGGHRAARRIWDQTANCAAQRQHANPAILKDFETAQIWV